MNKQPAKNPNPSNPKRDPAKNKSSSRQKPETNTYIHEPSGQKPSGGGMIDEGER